MMSLLILSLLISDGDALKTTHRYVKPAGDKFVLESEIEDIRTKEGRLYVSNTVRGEETMTLKVQYGFNGIFEEATIEHKKGKTKKKAVIVLEDGKLKLTRDGKTEVIAANPEAIFTTAPDWSDVLEMAARYDRRKGGKQEFAGVWFHPTQPTLTPTFTIEKQGEDEVTIDDKKTKLSRFRVTLRGGSAYRVWTLADGRVCRIVPEGGKNPAAVLDGFEKTTAALR